MKQKDISILGISLGAKTSGVAVISYGSLIHWQVHTVYGKWSTAKLHFMLDRYETYIKKYDIARVVIKIPPYTHHTPAITTLFKQLLKRCQYHGCVVEYSTKATVMFYVPEARTPVLLMQYVVNRYPVLLHEQQQEHQLQFPYHIKMFEAVLVAHLVYSELWQRGK